MGTRQQPGSYDCHDAALDDEPRFTLLARDPLAGFLVSIWSSMRFGDFEAAEVKFLTMLDRAGQQYVMAPDVARGGEAIECAMAMFAWRKENEGRWRKPEARSPTATEAALDAAVMALRSYQHGNSSADLAREIADAGEKALRDAGLAPTISSGRPS